MGVLIDAEDFTGRFAIPQSVNSKLTSVIADTEENYLTELLGADLYTAFKADLTAQVPVTAKYLAIYNVFRKDYGSRIYISQGMKQMLLGFVFFDFMRQVKFKNTESGQVVNDPDTAMSVSSGTLYKFLNEATETYNSIQTYITLIRAVDYAGTPTFNGQYKGLSNPTLQ